MKTLLCSGSRLIDMRRCSHGAVRRVGKCQPVGTPGQSEAATAL